LLEVVLLKLQGLPGGLQLALSFLFGQHELGQVVVGAGHFRGELLVLGAEAGIVQIEGGHAGGIQFINFILEQAGLFAGVAGIGLGGGGPLVGAEEEDLADKEQRQTNPQQPAFYIHGCHVFALPAPGVKPET